MPRVIPVGSGGGLNLKVVGGTTQPTSPKGNTVWVNTSTAINGYAFSNTEPTNPVAGMVWFSAGTSSNAAMNIDKKNTVMLYPRGCKQYVNGAWVTKTAKVYQNGAWVELWTGMLFNDGDEYTVITGGFSAVGEYQSDTGNSGGYLALHAGYGATGAYLTNEPIDLTDFSTLAAIAKCTGSNTKALGIAKERGTNFTALTYITATSDTAITLDISAYTGPYYVGILSNSNNWAYAKQLKLEV